MFPDISEQTGDVQHPVSSDPGTDGPVFEDGVVPTLPPSLSALLSLYKMYRVKGVYDPCRRQSLVPDGNRYEVRPRPELLTRRVYYGF